MRSLYIHGKGGLCVNGGQVGSDGRNGESDCGAVGSLVFLVECGLGLGWFGRVVRGGGG